MSENTTAVTLSNNKVVSAAQYAHGRRAYDYLRANPIDSYYGRVMSGGGDEVYLEDLPMVDYFYHHYNDIETLRKIQSFVMVGSFTCQHWTDAPRQKFPLVMTLEEGLSTSKVQFFYGNWRKPSGENVPVMVHVNNYGANLKPEYEGDEYYNVDASWEDFISVLDKLNSK